MKKLTVQQLHIVINLHGGEMVCYDMGGNPSYAIHPRAAYEVAQSESFAWGYYYPLWAGMGLNDRGMNKKQFKKAYSDYRKWVNRTMEEEPEARPGFLK